MFQPGEYIVYGCKGIHKIIEITKLDFDGINNDKPYYMMQPCKKPEALVYAPVGTLKVNMRPIMSKDEAHDFIDHFTDIEVLNIRSNKHREEAFKECIKSCDPEELMRVIKTIYLRRDRREKQGKKLTLTDIHYLKQAENILFVELALTLDKDEDDLPEYIDKLSKLEAKKKKTARAAKKAKQQLLKKKMASEKEAEKA